MEKSKISLEYLQGDGNVDEGFRSLEAELDTHTHKS